MNETLHIHGIPPQLAGARCEQLVAQQYWYRGELADDLNAIYLQCDGTWHRLVFDYGDIFWRPQSPEPFDAPDIEARYPLVDLGMRFPVLGRRVSGYEMTPIEGGSQVELRFMGGGRLVFQSVNDRTLARWIEE